MINKNQLRYYSSLLKKKYRHRERKFLAEGEKIIEEGLKSKYSCEKIFTTHEFYEVKKLFPDSELIKDIPIEVLKKSELQRLTDTVTPQGAAAVFKIPAGKQPGEIKSSLIIYLENISDPGNLGTILRTCDWFGIDTVLLSENSVDVYNPKVIRGSMGSIFHLDITDEVSINFLQFLKENGYNIICSDIYGKSIYDFKLPGKAVLAFCNEASGPSDLLLKISDYRVTVPKKGNAESLNVGAAAAVVLSELTN
jgi:RNA methyltransferase, TrmH family